MEVSVEVTSGLGRRMKVELPEDRVTGEVQDRLKQMSRTVKMDGFRQGKVPLRIVTQRFGGQVRDEVVDKLVKSSFQEAVAEQKLNLAGGLNIEPVESETGAGVIYTAEFDIYPDVVIAPLDKLEITRLNAELADTDVERMIERLQRQRRTWSEVKRAAKTGDRLRVDFDGIMDGEELDGGKGSDVTLEIGSGGMIKGFEEGLIGAKGGDERELDLDFPEDYHVEGLQGKSVQFKVKVHLVEEGELPEIDDEFGRGYGVQEGGVEAFKAEVRKNLQRELDDALRAKTKEQVLDKLLEANPVELPNAMLQQETARLYARQRQSLIKQGAKPEDIKLDPEALTAQANRRLALALLLAEITKAGDIVPDDDKVKEMVANVAASYEDPKEVISWFHAEDERLSEIRSAVLEEQIVEYIMAQAKVSEESTSVDALLNP